MEPTRGGDKTKDAEAKANNANNEAMIQLQTRGHSGQGSCRDDAPEQEIRDDDLIVQILARLDGPSYREALYQDAKSLNENFLMPPHFPWHSRIRLSHKMTKTMPRDIDDLHVVTHCQDELHAPFGDFQGPFGFGRYDNAQHKGNYSLKPENLSVASRRSRDPGVLELNALTKLPPSIDAVMNDKEHTGLTPAERWKAELMKDPDQARILSHLPFYWAKRGEGLLSADKQVDHSACGNIEAHVEHNFESKKLAKVRSKSRAELELAASCMKKWYISYRVGGVSSRSSLFPSSTVIETNNRDNTRKVFRPMLCLASLPQSVQSGKTVSMEKASEMDSVGLAHGLGSYDCRVTEPFLNLKRDDNNRAKQIEVGRTRLIWSDLIQGDEPFLPSTRNRVSFNSLITGQRIDASKCKRPTEVKVGVRLNGRIVMEEALEDLPSPKPNSAQKRKHSTRQAENKPQALTSCLQCPESRTDEEIDVAIQNNSIHLQVKPQENARIDNSTENGAVVYVEAGDQSLSHYDIDRKDIIVPLLKFHHRKISTKKVRRRSMGSSMSGEANPALLGGSQVIKRSNPPRFACLPLEDGLLRTVCLNAGNMAGTAVHQVIRDLSEQSSVKMCSVCWSDEGSGKEGVQECVKCGLLAHSNCCRDKGEFSYSHTVPERQHVNPKGAKQTKRDNTNGSIYIDTERSDDLSEQWQCAVCCHYKGRKPQMPSRFADSETYSLSKRTGDDDLANKNANVPGPRCSLCPHRGGAMSPISPGSSSWAHEVCRVWSCLDLSSNPKTDGCLPLYEQLANGSPLSTICALCGTGGLKYGSGLARCAARGCLVAFHPMCALLASKVGMDGKDGKAKSVRTRKTRHTGEVLTEEKKSDVNEDIEADKILCKEYTLQLAQLRSTERVNGSTSEYHEAVIIPVAFCGIHNPRRKSSFLGCLPGGTIVEVA